jgi:hypothetical protein
MTFFTRLFLSTALNTILLSRQVAALAFAPTPTVLKASRLGIQAAFEPTTISQAKNDVLELRQNSQNASLATCGWVAGNTGRSKAQHKTMMASLADRTDSKPSNLWRIVILRNDQYVYRLLRTLIVYRHFHDLLRLARRRLQCGLPK